MDEQLLESLKKRYRELESKRSTFNVQFTDLQRYVRPVSSSFYGPGVDSGAVGERRHQEIYDSTASWAADQFANGLHSSVTNPSEAWFKVVLAGVSTNRLLRVERQYLDEVNEALYYNYNLPQAGLVSALHENYLDLGVFGTDILYQDWNPEYRTLSFIPVSLGECYLDEGVFGLVDTVFRVKNYSLRNVLQLFPEAAGVERIAGERQEKTITLIHSVYPNSDKGQNITNKTYASVYWSPDLRYIFSKSGYDTFPYHISRWTKQTGEIYGRSPGMTVLPSIQWLNQAKKELLVSAQLANRPPLVVDEDSLLLPVGAKKGFSIAPGSLLTKYPGAEMPTPLMSGSQPQLTLEMVQAEQERITQAFYVDYLIRQKKKERQSVLEIQDDRGEMMRQMAPMCGRVESEKLGPMIARSFQILNEHRMLPDMPDSLKGRRLSITYTSPVAKAQLGATGIAISGFLQDLSTVGTVRPQIWDAINDDRLVEAFALSRGIPVAILKSEEERNELKQQQAQQQQMAQMTEMAPQMSKAMKDVAQARQVDPSMLGGF